jgi:hypothetical protein
MKGGIEINQKILKFTKIPSWLKWGISIGFFLSVLVMILPDRFTNLAFVPWYLEWLIVPAFLIFSALCIFFGVDFISNFHPSEGPWRPIILYIFGFISLFAISFIVGIVIWALINVIRKIRRIK